MDIYTNRDVTKKMLNQAIQGVPEEWVPGLVYIFGHLGEYY